MKKRLQNLLKKIKAFWKNQVKNWKHWNPLLRLEPRSVPKPKITSAYLGEDGEWVYFEVPVSRVEVMSKRISRTTVLVDGKEVTHLVESIQFFEGMRNPYEEE